MAEVSIAEVDQIPVGRPVAQLELLLQSRQETRVARGGPVLPVIL